MKGLLTLLSFFFTHQLLSQDSLVYFKDLTFNSTLEQSAFTEPDSSTFNLFLTADEHFISGKEESYLRKFEAYLNTVNNKKLDRKSNEKKVKLLYEEVHSAFLNKYEMQNHFSSIFINGNYNCVSATALYGLVFQKLNIPYVIKEKPTHVYMVAFPGIANILLETTDPSGDFLTYTDRYKTAMVAQLASAKLISESELKSKSVDDIFNEYYFSDEDINLVQLAGLQYVNDALYRLEKNDLEGALIQSEKAYFLYPKENITSLIAVILGQLLDKIAYEDIVSMDYLEKFSRYKKFNITHENILAEFDLMCQRQLIEKGDSTNFRKYYERFVLLNKDEKLNNQISYLYFLRKGLALYKSGHFESALPHIEKAYNLNSANIEVSQVFVSAIAQNLRFKSNNTEVINKLELYLNKYPDLQSNNNFNSLLVGSYLIEFGQSYDLNNEQSGIKYRKLFEESYNNGLNVDQQNIGRAYSLAAIFYFKRGYKQKAISILNKGLELAPGNYELLTRKRMIE